MKSKTSFTFINPGKLVDNDLELFLLEKIPINDKLKLFPAYRFDMKSLVNGNSMGNITLNIRSDEYTKYRGHIGYNVYREYRGNYYAARSLKLLFPLALYHNINPLWVNCDENNIASRKTCEYAGGELIEIITPPPTIKDHQGGGKRKCRFKFELSDFV